MEPPHHTFVKRHSICKNKDQEEEQKEQPEDTARSVLSPLSNISPLSNSGRSSSSAALSTSEEREPWSKRFIYSLTGREELAREETIQSVFLATGLFMDADEHIGEIPVRHKASTRSALRWFIDLCAAGLGKLEYKYFYMNAAPLCSLIPLCSAHCFPQVCSSMHTS
jgi:hypothetical protein